jgi:hypothetical protein
MRDLHNNVTVRRVLSPASVSDNTAQVGQIIDVQGHKELEFVISTGTLTTGAATFTTLIEHGDAANLSDAAAVSDSQLIGTEAAASFTGADDDKVYKIGYTGSKRYVRLTITPASNAAAASLSAVAILGRPILAPVT